jgi:bifunctional oligoribonuclease and PAP phosphatase NrnA
VSAPTGALDAAADAIASAPEVALACHEWPDGDALGSMMALFHLCRSQGRKCLASWPEPEEVAPHYRFLPGLSDTTPPARFPTEPHVMVTFDCGSIERLGKLQVAARAARQLVVLDHHATNSGYGSINVIDPDAAATAVIVRRLAARLGWPLNREAAFCLYTGLVTDTGRFQYSNTTPEVFALAEELAGFDLPIEKITRELFEKSRFAYIQMAASCLARAQLDEAAGMVSATITEEDLTRFGVALEETEGFIDIVRRTAEARVAVVARYSPDGVRVSLRSMDGTDVGAVAVALGGGGHAHASGFTHRGSVDGAVALVRAALPPPDPPAGRS